MAEGGTRTAGSADLIGLSYEVGAAFGSAVAVGDLNGDGRDELVVASREGSHGAVWVLEGPSSGVHATSSGDYVAKITGADPWDLVDAALLANRDLNGDGISDLALGLPWAGSANEGAVAVFYGPVVGNLGVADADAVITGATTNGYLGTALTAASGGGSLYLAVGEPGPGSGRVRLWNVDVPLSGTLSSTSADTVWEGNVSGDEFGYALAVGEIGGDEVIVVGAPEEAPGGAVYGLTADLGSGEIGVLVQVFSVAGGATCTRCGEVVQLGPDLDPSGAVDDDLVFMNDNGEAMFFYTPTTGLDATDADAVLNTPNLQTLSFATLGVNGTADPAALVVGDPAADADGAVYLIYAGSAPTTDGAVASFAGQVFTGGASGDTFGGAVAAGDLNGDGRYDVAVGVPADDVDAFADAGSARVFYGPYARLEGTDELINADAILYGDDSGDLSGYSVAGIGDVNCDGVADVAIGAVMADESAATTGALYVLFGPTPESGPLEWLNTAVDLGMADLVFYETSPGDFAGNTVVGLGDVNGDACDDFLLAASGDDTSASNAGAAYLFYGDELLAGTYHPLDADAVFRGGGANDALGTGVGAAGDWDGDGYADVLIGAPYKDGIGADSGQALVYFGGEGANLLTGNIVAADADCTFGGQAAGDRAGWKLRGELDFNGDGHQDILVGAPGNDAGGADAGAVYVVRGGASRCSGAASLGTASLRVRGVQAQGQLGHGLASMRDVDGDGYDDFVVGAPYYNADSGRAYWVPGSTATGTLPVAAGGTRLCAGGSYEGRMGWSVAAPDVDGDGADDVWVGAPWATVDGNAKGGLGLVFYADTLAAWKGDGVCHDDTEADVKVTGEAALDFAGWSMADAGDLNQDGEDDVLLGAYGSDVSGPGAGAAYLVLSAHLVP